MHLSQHGFAKKKKKKKTGRNKFGILAVGKVAPFCARRVRKP